MRKLWKGVMNVVRTFIDILRAIEYESKNRYEGRDK